MYSNNPAPRSPSRLASIQAAQVLATLAPSMLRTLPRARPCQAALPSGVFGRCQHQCRLGCQDPSSQKTSIQNHFHVTLAQCGTAWHWHALEITWDKEQHYICIHCIHGPPSSNGMLAITGALCPTHCMVSEWPGRQTSSNVQWFSFKST